MAVHRCKSGKGVFRVPVCALGSEEAALFRKKKCVFTEKKAEIEKLAEEYVATVKNLASEQRVEHLQKIQNAYTKCKEFSDDKVQLAMQTYEMVGTGRRPPGARAPQASDAVL